MNIPLGQSYDTVRFTITIGGNKISDRYPVMSISVESGINKIPSADIVLLDGDPASRDFPISDSDDFFPGSKIVISAVYDRGAETVLFSGIVQKHSIKADSGSNPTISVNCKHEAIKMTFNETDSGTFDKDDTEDKIIQKIFSEKYQLQGNIIALPKARQVQQHASSDWDFVISRCDVYGLHLTFDSKGYTIKRPKLTGGSVLQVDYGISMLSFSAELDVDKQASSITGTSWNTQSQKNLTAKAKEPAMTQQISNNLQEVLQKVKTSPITLSASTPMAQEVLQAWVDGQMVRTRMSLIKGQTSFQGTAIVTAGSIITLTGVGERFSGDFYVSSLTHNISDGNWVTSVEFGAESPEPLSRRANISSTPANGQIPAVHGLQTAKVQSISNDPDGLFRAKVLLQTTGETQQGLWARMSTLYATKNNGAFFFPEKDDEVVIGFIDSDPRHPIVLGSVYSDGRNAAITPPDDKNYVKQLTTNSNLKLSFDDQHKEIQVITPGNNSVKLSDKDQSILITDQNGNTFKMSPDGIEISSCKDIKMSAKGEIKINADQSISIEATTDLECKGLDVSVSANAELKVQGQATAELSATGQTTVKGAIVMIN